MTKVLDKIADAAGILCFLLVSVGYIAFVSPFIPVHLPSSEAVHAHLAAHPPTTVFWVGLWLEAAGLAFLVVLAARVAGRIRDRGAASWLPTTAVGLAVASFAVKVGSVGPVIVASDVERYGPETVTALLDLNDAAHGVSWALDVGFLLVLGLGVLATSALPRWLGALALLAAAGGLAGLAVPELSGLLRTLFLVWLLATSGWLLVRGNRVAAVRDADRVPA